MLLFLFYNVKKIPVATYNDGDCGKVLKEVEGLKD
jgi:hypothetical protein